METGRGAADLFCWGELVMMGGRGGWLGFEVGDETVGGEVVEEGLADMTVDMFDRGWASEKSRATSQRQSRPGWESKVSWAVPATGSTICLKTRWLRVFDRQRGGCVWIGWKERWGGKTNVFRGGPRKGWSQQQQQEIQR